MDHVTRVAAISTAAMADLYVIATPDADPARLAADCRSAVTAATPDLPPGGRVAAVVALARGTGVPPVTAAKIDQFQITIDGPKAAARGVSVADIDAAVSGARLVIPARPAVAADIPALNAVIVTGARGHQVRLGDIAVVTINAEAVAVRRDF